LRILYIAYPLLPVSEHSPGGAEQVLWTLEREMKLRGHSTCVAACAGSQIAGDLFPTGESNPRFDESERVAAAHNGSIRDWLQDGAASKFDLIHDMSGGFWSHAHDLPLPVLATLHLPRRLYKPLQFDSISETVSFSCVSQSQMAEFGDLPRMLGSVGNGIALDRFAAGNVPIGERQYALWLGRICEEKGPHTALDVAHAGGERLILAGAVYPFLYHQKYFAREIIPRLKRAGSRTKFVESPSFPEKLELIRNARALLITSQINETSSIVAMEAAACGTPVIAIRRGALPEVVEQDVTGFLVSDADEMIAALARVSQIDSEQCRRYAQQHYSAARMADEYSELYEKIFASRGRVSDAMLVWSRAAELGRGNCG
jgi:glycosyltransferase involved in cell wall biosynthesis